MSDPQITVAENGPYLVSGEVPLRRREMIVSEHGEPLTWKPGAEVATKDRYALCRCGLSDNKPFCDGTHARDGFDGTEHAPDSSYGERRTTYEGTGMTMYDDRGICVHAGFCGNQQTNVWKMMARTDDTVVRSQAMAMIERCPSGAITFEVDGQPVEPDLPQEIDVIPDGPLWVKGGLRVQRADGTILETRNRVTLCRCGASSTKPLCDGSHGDAGFSG